jgi:hypothetical protein
LSGLGQFLDTARRFLLHRFPYNLIYQIKTDEIRVIVLAQATQIAELLGKV